MVGDSYARAREGDTGLDGGWPTLLGVPVANQQAVSGSKAEEWASDVNGMLSKAVATPTGVLIISLLGNDAFAIETSHDPSTAVLRAAAAYKALECVLVSLQRETMYVLLYPDAFDHKNQGYNIGLPMLNGAIRQAVAEVCPHANLVDLGKILDASDFNGTDIHPIHSGQVKIAEYFKSILTNTPA